jgi:cytosine/adenosine deaminase-related metal-dependent hydrolase
VVGPPVSWEASAQHPTNLADMRARRVAAQWVLPIDRPPIEHGAMLVGPDGRIKAVGPDTAVPRPRDVPCWESEKAVLLPGLINTHTHLELTGFEGQIPECEFPLWIRRLRELKLTRTPAEYLEAARQGLRDCYASGVTTIADTGDSGSVLRALSEVEGSGIAYQEVFGPDPAQATESLAGLQAAVDKLARITSPRARVGVSPHAPYTVSGPLFQAVAGWAGSEGLPMAVHVAESPAEMQFLFAGTGPFGDAWLERRIPLPVSRGHTPIAWLDEHGILTDRTLCIHAVQVTPSDVRRMAEKGAAVSHCPLSNRAHGHGSAPLDDFLEAGLRVGLGTDSVVSVGRLDLLAEARAARQLAPLDAEQLLELCTLGGARALGVETETGSLRPGKWADYTVIRLSDGPGAPAERVLGSSPRDVLLTCVGGREVYHSA